MRRYPVTLLACLLVFLASCVNTPTQILYKSLATVGATENASVAGAWTLYSNHQINAAQWKTVASLHDQRFLPAWNTALDAAIAAVKLTEVGTNSMAAALATQAPADLVQIVNDVAALVASYKH